MSRLYFAHSYQPGMRRFNERIWRALMDCGFTTWIDRGVEQGTEGRRYPMDVSFNEWMMSRCDGFIAVAPPGASRYLDLEYRLALRMGLPTLVMAAEGASVMAGKPDHEFPVSWTSFLSLFHSDRIRRLAADFAERVDAAKGWREAHRAGGRRLKVCKSRPGVALLPPSGQDPQWSEARRLLRSHAPTLLLPENFQRPGELIDQLDGECDLLVVDVGANGTPREMLGYLEAHGIALVRVCRVEGIEPEAPAAVPWDAVDLPIRDPYVQWTEKDGARRSGATTWSQLSPLTDGLRIDRGMRPVLFWNSAEQLADRVSSLLKRIEGFRAGFDEDSSAQTLKLETQGQARKYFAPPESANSVFLSFAGGVDTSPTGQQKRALADQLARVFRFHDLRCFHYKDKDGGADGRLESGELVNQGLEKRIDEADVVVILFDQAYRDSEFCMGELKQAMALSERGLLKVRAYKLEESDLPLDEFKDMNVYEHAGNWGDAGLLDGLVADVVTDSDHALAALRETEAMTIKSWLREDGRQTGSSVHRMMTLAGVPGDELAALRIDWDKADACTCVDQLLKQPEAKVERPRRRALLTLLLDALSTNRPERKRLVARWMRANALVGRMPETAVTFEHIVEVPEALTPVALNADRVVLGQKIGQAVPGVLHLATPLALRADRRAAEVPIEWARENAETEPVCVRRQIRWILPHSETRQPLIEDVSTRALPPRYLLLALKGEHIDPKREIDGLRGELVELYLKNDWPPEFVRAEVCQNVDAVKLQLENCSFDIVHIAGHMGADALQVASEQISSEVLGRWLAESAVRLVVLNGCEGARPASDLALHGAAIADKLVQLGKVPEVVAHRIRLTDADGMAFASSFARAFVKTFDAAAACFDARRAGSIDLRLSPVLFSQRAPRTG